ncbi:MAG: hypothetical protein U9Q81_22335 [Pseudomonadota bacterium]|nr:hypothetical protein [Pseudomonadota bacterium]
MRLALPLVAMATAPFGAVAYTPDPVQPSEITVEVAEVGTMPSIAGNLASPVAIKDTLYLIDQWGAIYRMTDEGNLDLVFDTSDAPDGLQLDNRQSVLNIAAPRNGNTVYIVFTSGNLPDLGVPAYQLPDPLPGNCCVTGEAVRDLFRLDPMPNAFALNLFGPASRTEYQVIYEYKLTGKKLRDPRPIVSFETQSGPTHNGGGLLVLPDGRLLFAAGDSLPFGTEGRFTAQDDNEHVSKLLIIDPATSTVEPAGKGVRNVQRLTYADDKQTMIGFADIGGVTAEEVNFVSTADIMDTSTVENFGWGRNADGLAREGTFYVGPGIPGLFGTEPPAEGIAPTPEPAFIQPQSQFGRSDPAQFIAVSGPVASKQSLDTVTHLFGNLSSGSVYASIASFTATAAPVYEVNLVDEYGNPTTLNTLAGGVRSDPRFFDFPDGKAGVLLEATGRFYELTQIQ